MIAGVHARGPIPQLPDKPEAVYFYGTCLVDLFFPEAGLSGIRLIERGGVRVIYPQGQTCCGQPAYNSGYHEEARNVARAQLALFAKPFPVVKDLITDRSAFDKIQQAGGFISVRTGAAPDANSIPVPKEDADLAMDAAIGDDLYPSVGEQYVDQHAAIAFGIPDAQASEEIERTLMRRLPAHDMRQRQRGLDHETNLPGMCLLAGAGRSFDASERFGRKRAVDGPVVGREMKRDALQAR